MTAVGPARYEGSEQTKGSMRVRAKATQSPIVRWTLLPVCVNSPASAKGSRLWSRIGSDTSNYAENICGDFHIKGCKESKGAAYNLWRSPDRKVERGHRNRRERASGCRVRQSSQGSKGSKEVSALFEAGHRRERAPPLLEFAAVVNQFAYRWAERAWPGNPAVDKSSITCCQMFPDCAVQNPAFWR